MSPGSPDASDELQVIPRRPSGAPPAPGRSGNSRPPSEHPVRPPFDPERKKRLTRIVAAAVGACSVILIAAGIARAVRPHEAAPAATATSTATSTSTSTSTPTATSTATPTATPTAAAPTTGTLLLDRPAAPGKVWIDGKKVTAKSLETSCGKHQVKIGAYGKSKSVNIPCGGELHVSR